MKSFLLFFSILTGLGVSGQINFCNLQPPTSRTLQYRMDLLKEDPAHKGTWYLARGSRTDDYDTTFKWRIYKVDAKKDIPVTDTFICINDFRVRADNKLAVVGQMKDPQITGYSLYDNRYSYTVWNIADGKIDGPPLFLNASFRQYRFDHANYLAVNDTNNVALYVNSDGPIRTIDPAIPTAQSLLSPVYPGKINLFAILHTLKPQSSYLLVMDDPTQGTVFFKKQPADSIAHLKTGKYLVKKAGNYKVYDAETDGFSDPAPHYQDVGADTILLFDDNLKYKFIDDNGKPRAICAAPDDTIQSIGYYPGDEPVLVNRYIDDSLSLYTFDACGAGKPQKIPFIGVDTLIPLLRDDKALFYLTRLDAGNLAIYKAAIHSKQFVDARPTQVFRFRTDIAWPNLSLYKLASTDGQRFLLVMSGDAATYSAIVIQVSTSDNFSQIPVVSRENALQFVPGNRFLSSFTTANNWTTHDLLLDKTVDPPDLDKNKIILVERLYPAPCEPTPTTRTFYYNYMVDTDLKLGKYQVTTATKKITANRRKGITPNKKSNAR